MIYPRYAVKAAYDTAMTLYKTHDEAVAAVARELCISTEMVEEALAPEAIQ